MSQSQTRLLIPRDALFYYLNIEGALCPSDPLVQSLVVLTLRTRCWTWLLLVSGGTPASSAVRPIPPTGPPAPPRAAVARRRGIFPESDLEKQNQTLGWIWSTLLAGFHSIFDFKASHRSVPSKVMVSKFAPTSLRNSRWLLTPAPFASLSATQNWSALFSLLFVTAVLTHC